MRLLPAVAVACLMASCQNGGGNLSESSSQTDSLMYYLGQMNAGDYLREAERDTALKEFSARQAYIDGVKAGLNILKDGNENFNRGVMLGMQMASNMINFSEQMDVKINKSAYAGSLSSAISADTMPDVQRANDEFRRIMGDIEKAKKDKDDAASRESLRQAAQNAGLPKIDDDLYGKVTSTTDGQILNVGDDVTLQVTLTQLDGKTVNLPLPDKGKVGNNRSFPSIISNAMLNLKSGESGEFMTTAHALLGARAKQLGLETNDVIKMTVKATFVPAEEEKDKPKTDTK